jgi:hypothetical protein
MKWCSRYSQQPYLKILLWTKMNLPKLMSTSNWYDCKGTENNRTLAGQNIYNVYSVRSYKAEVEMLGNAMIQPMMHFQLNNIPMFHGG